MYHYLEGILQPSPQGYAVLDVHGVGYRVAVSDRSAGELFGREGETVRLYTYLNVREDAMELFGFLNETQKNVFLHLISVSGIGAKGAMNILSALDVERLCFAILSDDARAISSANGIGLKSAQKIILELKDKFAKDPALAHGAGEAAVKTPIAEGSSKAMSEAVSALVVLGYPRAQVEKAAAKLDGNAHSVEDLIRLLLQKFGGQ